MKRIIFTFFILTLIPSCSFLNVKNPYANCKKGICTKIVNTRFISNSCDWCSCNGLLSGVYKIKNKNDRNIKLKVKCQWGNISSGGILYDNYVVVKGKTTEKINLYSIIKLRMTYSPEIWCTHKVISR